MSLFNRKKNSRFTSTETILEQMRERRPLPLGVTDFHEWSDRIIAGACIPGATTASQKFSLADIILHLGPQESHKEDAYFIHTLRKSAINQVADHMRREIRDQRKAEMEEEQKTIKKLEIEKRHEDQMVGWSQTEKDEFIHAIYLKENSNLVNLPAQVQKTEQPSAATPTSGVADEKPSEKTRP